MSDHALLSASSASKWITCPPSVRLEQKVKHQKAETNTDAETGTLAHALGELMLKKAFQLISKSKYNIAFKKIEVDPLFTADMIDYVQTYVDVCMEKISPEEKAKVLIEQKLIFSEWVPEAFGTGDCIIITDNTIEIIDLKYGKGIPVSAIGNTQMRLYALGALHEYGFLYDIENIRMTIVQPRLDSITSDDISVIDLMEWAINILKPTARLAFEGKGEFKAGDNCTFCKAKGICAARAEANMELAKFEFENPDLLSKEDISEILDKSNEMLKWIKDVQEYALISALAGEKYPGYKLVEGRSNRKWTDENSVYTALLNNGYKDEDLYKKELIGITDVEKLLGKKAMGEMLGQYIIKPFGKPTLTNITDKRPELMDFESEEEL